MRKIVLALGISIDGYIARPDGAFDFLSVPSDFSMADFFESIDTAIMGRKTYEVVKAQGEDPFTSKLTTYILSRTLPAGQRDGRIFTNETPDALVESIRQNKGKDVWLMGGGEVARDFLQADLVDEMHIGIVPVLLGEGLPLFPSGFPQRDFELLENKTFSGGLISVKYKRARQETEEKS
ncbi:MAG TPA: dihydrofolate reductase family protein [Candidatus Angelobacter sp.]|nr:dihydrofolate reductase family protein [Candidatus Angelobacter sp.]